MLPPFLTTALSFPPISPSLASPPSPYSKMTTEATPSSSTSLPNLFNSEIYNDIITILRTQESILTQTLRSYLPPELQPYTLVISASVVLFFIISISFLIVKFTAKVCFIYSILTVCHVLYLHYSLQKHTQPSVHYTSPPKYKVFFFPFLFFIFSLSLFFIFLYLFLYI